MLCKKYTFLFFLLSSAAQLYSQQQLVTDVPSPRSEIISCDSLMSMPFLRFHPSKLPEGFLDCFGGHTADIMMMKKYMQVLSSNRGDDYTVGEMKRILDSVDQATDYRANALRIEACRAEYRRALIPENWSEDSLALHACGARPLALEAMGKMVRSGRTEEDWTLGQLFSVYERELADRLESEALQHSNYCGNGSARRFSFGLKAFDDPEAALECAAAKDLPVLFIFSSWMNSVTRRLEESTLRELDLFTRINRESIVLVLYEDDPSPLPPEMQYKSPADGSPINTRGGMAQDWAYRYLKIKSPPGVVVLNAKGEKLDELIGEPTRDDLIRMLDRSAKGR